MPLSPGQLELLQSIASGLALKSHRNLEGHKEYRLHALDGRSTRVSWGDVEALQTSGLIDSNKKFPAATYWLTDEGRAFLKSTALPS